MSVDTAPVPTTKELVERALAEVLTAHDDYARRFLDRMLAGEQPSEWDYAAAIIAADVTVTLEDFLGRKNENPVRLCHDL